MRTWHCLACCAAIACAAGSPLRGQDAAAAAPPVKITPDVVYGHKHGMALTFDVYQPEVNSKGLGVLFMVSGGWYSRWQDPEAAGGMFAPLTGAGFTVFAVRHGSSPKFGIPEAVDDVRRSVRFVRSNAERFAIDPDRLGVYGYSAGGHLSLMLGTTSDAGDPTAGDPVAQAGNGVQAVVAFVAPTDLRIMVWEAPDHLPAYKNFPALDLPLAEADDVSPLVHVTPDDAPALLIAGDADDLVPVSHSRKIHAAFNDQGVETKLVEFPGAGHGLEGDDLRQGVAELVAWFERHLTPAEDRGADE
jgi:acetyl esterase/lipase